MGAQIPQGLLVLGKSSGLNFLQQKAGNRHSGYSAENRLKEQKRNTKGWGVTLGEMTVALTAAEAGEVKSHGHNELHKLSKTPISSSLSGVNNKNHFIHIWTMITLEYGYWLTATSNSQVQAILLPQATEKLGLQSWGFTVLLRLVSNSQAQVIHLPQPPKVLGLQA
ncbi:hypothetical protein AAY473_010159 [Plecturocebus cupreus]